MPGENVKLAQAWVSKRVEPASWVVGELDVLVKEVHLVL